MPTFAAANLAPIKSIYYYFVVSVGAKAIRQTRGVPSVLPWPLPTRRRLRGSVGCACRAARGVPRGISSSVHRLINVAPHKTIGKTRTVPKVYFYQAFKKLGTDFAVMKLHGNLRASGVKIDRSLAGLPGRPLSIVQDDDLLLIGVHGDSDMPNQLYSYQRGGSKNMMTTNELAAQLHRDGLKKSHQSILLIACEGAGFFSPAPGAAPNSNGQLLAAHATVSRSKAFECAASFLASALGLSGYYSILVGGFPGRYGFQESPTGTKPTLSADIINDNNTIQTVEVNAELDHIQWFNCKGKNTI